MKTKKILNAIKLIIITLIITIALQVIFAFTLLALPTGIQQTIVDAAKIPLKMIDSKNSSLKLATGKVCSYESSKCLNSFILSGTFSIGDESIIKDRLDMLMSANPEINMVCLNSKGGYNSTAGYIAGLIRERKLNTCVGDLPLTTETIALPGFRYTASCESACAFVLLSGAKRIAIGERFTLGIHSPYPTHQRGAKEQIAHYKSKEKANFLDAELKKQIMHDYEEKLSITTAHFEKILTEASRTPSQKMYSVSTREQMDLGFFTERL